MACYNCTQEIKNKYEQANKMEEQAQYKANETGEWWAIYEEAGQTKIIRADTASREGIAVKKYVSPKL